MAVSNISAPALANAVWTADKVEEEVIRRWEDQRGVEVLKDIPWGGAERVVPRPPSRRRILGRMGLGQSLEIVGYLTLC